MSRGMKTALIILGLFVLVIAGLTTAASLARQESASAAAGDPSRAPDAPPAPAPTLSAPAPPPVPQYMPLAAPPPQPMPQPMPQYQPPQPPRPQQQGGWNAQNLAGTTWAVGTPYGNIIVSLLPGGQATASTPMGPVTGTWNASNKSLTVSAMGKSYTCRIQGWQIIAQDGIPITQM